MGNKPRIFVMLALLAFAPWTPEPLADDGVFFTATLLGSELDAPRQSPGTDVGLFRGLGIAPAVGYRMGRFRVEGELQFHYSSPLGFGSDSLDVQALMANGYLDIALSKSSTLFLGAGLGRAEVDIDFSTCLEPQGCRM